MKKMIVLISLFPLVLGSCSSSIQTCPKRSKNESITWGELAYYLGGLEKMHDSCSN